jgi:hypothetical protein
MFYAGAEEKRAFASALQARAAGVAPETIEFALFDPLGIGSTYGANTNAVLLDTCGRLILHADDDTVFRFASLPEANAGLRLSSAADPTEVRFEAAVEPRDVDILAAHEALLGRSVADCLRAHGGDADCSELAPESLPLLEGGGRVAAAMAGVCGDSGMGSPLFVLWLSGRSRELALQSEQHYRTALRMRRILRATTQPTLGSSALLMSMHLGLDNRQLLPPFLPALRNADGLFGQVLRASLPRCLVAHLPLAVLHLPGEQRAFTEEPRQQLRLADLLLLLVRSLAPAPRAIEGSHAIRILGAGMAETGRLEPVAFQCLLRQLWAEEMSRHILALEQLLAEHAGELDYWATDAEAWMEQIRSRVTAGEPLVPADLENTASALSVVSSYGELLLAWPSMHMASTAMISAGTPIARPL